MRQQEISYYALVTIFLFLLYLAFLMLKPFFTAILLGFLFAYLLFPPYKWLAGWLGRKRLAAAVMISASLLLIIIPSFFFVTSLVKQTRATTAELSQLNLTTISHPFFEKLGITLEEAVRQVAEKVQEYFVRSAADILSSIASGLLTLFVMFFVMFFAFLNGKRWLLAVQEALPLSPVVKRRLFQRVADVTRAVTFGQFLTAVIQGSLGGLMFLFFGVPNWIFWTVIMIIFSFIPFLGTPFIFVPAAIIKLFLGDYVAGIGILIVGFVVVANIDNILRPVLIGSHAKISPLIVFLGVFGGLATFGLIGLLLGPLILALIQTVMSFLREDVGRQSRSSAARAGRRGK